jgi:2-succinyl-5-enolpyruvyl-6-hydroxy-3-cyclohexene-1-carboxylate synthase
LAVIGAWAAERGIAGVDANVQAALGIGSASASGTCLTPGIDAEWAVD